MGKPLSGWKSEPDVVYPTPYDFERRTGPLRENRNAPPVSPASVAAASSTVTAPSAGLLRPAVRQPAQMLRPLGTLRADVHGPGAGGGGEHVDVLDVVEAIE
jgi:hypothetical protein